MPAYVETLLQQCHDRWPLVHWRAYASATKEVFAELAAGPRVTIMSTVLESDPGAYAFHAILYSADGTCHIGGQYVLYTLDHLVRRLQNEIAAGQPFQHKETAIAADAKAL